MHHEHHRIGAAAARLAARLPFAVTLSVADAVTRHDGLGWPAARSAILQGVQTPTFRDDAADFLDSWRSAAGGVGAEAVAVALATAARCEFDHRHGETVEIVWTGPEVADTHFRHTEQAVLEVVDSATSRLTVVSYAVYRIPRIRDAIIAAANRGVGIRLIVETPNRIEGRGEYDCLLAFGDKVASACSVYYWPQENRPTAENGRTGSLHVKCAVADGRRLFLSSANLTEYAFTINLELGLLVTGGKLPARVQEHFDRLLSCGTFVRV